MTRDKGFAKDRIEKLLEDLGYKVDCKVLNASDYGVPQNRLRAFFVAIRNDYKETFDFEQLSKKQKVTVKEAIGELYDLDKNPKNKLTTKPQNKYLKYLRIENQEIFNQII